MSFRHARLMNVPAGGSACLVNDVAFLSELVAAIIRRTPIDPTRVYVTGMPNGAMMALRLGCQTTTFAAEAAVAGTLLTDCTGAHPTSVLQIHGTADTQVPYNGGPGAARQLNGLPRVDGPSIPSTNERDDRDRRSS
ncbi:hypothetical protein BST27_01960 [Mycobacterium intermedium]|uniref:Phospholipase/carboxylesterase/thioesterase domain-containing protein n=1 Tax=Mycobacterium intermedium TaxID=28445 RepID=A0A1X0G9B2_MYCIE|nr:hypothetical protein [Mycobacterium intermedium]ORB10359.1 hypothetical protein BST27_01960 [Mycobacterium intermedium]